MAGTEFLVEEAKSLREEIRDVNAKAMGITRSYGVMLLAFGSYIVAPLMWFIGITKDNSLDFSPTELLGLESTVLFLAHVYVAIGIIGSSGLMIVALYMLGQWARSKRHRVRMWRQIDAIREFLTSADWRTRAFSQFNLLPKDDRRPNVTSPNIRRFGSIVSLGIFGTFCASVLYFSVCWHLRLIATSRVTFDANQAIDRFGELIQSVAPATGFFVLAAMLCTNAARDYYEQIARAEAVTAATPYPTRAFGSKQSRVFWSKRFAYALALPAAILSFELGCFAVPTSQRGALLLFFAWNTSLTISAWWAFSVAAISCASISVYHYVKVRPLVRIMALCREDRLSLLRSAATEGGAA